MLGGGISAAIHYRQVGQCQRRAIAEQIGSVAVCAGHLHRLIGKIREPARRSSSRWVKDCRQTCERRISQKKRDRTGGGKKSLRPGSGAGSSEIVCFETQHRVCAARGGWQLNGVDNRI